VAYVRFASVYKRFKTLDELVDEARAVLDARRFEDPDQGRLFVEEPQPEATTTEANGRSAPARSPRRRKAAAVAEDPARSS
jgi:hypothetical protein